MAKKIFTFEEFNKTFWSAYKAEQQRIIKELNEEYDGASSSDDVEKEMRKGNRTRLREL